VFMWIALPLDSVVPRTLRHRLTFATADTSASAAAGGESSIDDIAVPVLSEPAVELRSPLPTGVWFAGNGPRNDSDHRRSITPENGTARISQRFAIDWLMIGANGNTWHDDQNKNEDYWGFGQPILSVASGRVTEVVDSIADNIPHAPLPPVTLANIAGNHVIVRIGPDRFVMFAHLRRGSIRVHQGQQVAAGDVLGALGNSGQATAPHMHFQVMDASSPLAAEGIPFVFDHFTFLGFGQDYPEKQQRSPRRREMPAGDAVVRFP
jgi:murein DD-endopeptidase MepM/ murein hydrolase activator NlpD